jgi:hypothetical protein
MRDSRLPPEVAAWMKGEGIPVDPAEIEAWLAAARVGIKASYRVAEAAVLLSMSPRAIYDLIARGDLVASRSLPGRGRSSASRRPHAYLSATRIPLPSLIRWYPRPD